MNDFETEILQTSGSPSFQTDHASRWISPRPPGFRSTSAVSSGLGHACRFLDVYRKNPKYKNKMSVYMCISNIHICVYVYVCVCVFMNIIY